MLNEKGGINKKIINANSNFEITGGVKK